MRHTIGYEGRDMGFGHILLPGALKWDDSHPYPVLEKSDYTSPIVGTASDIRREEDGRITAEIDFPMPTNLAATIFANEIKLPEGVSWAGEPPIPIESVVLRSLFFDDKVPWVKE